MLPFGDAFNRLRSNSEDDFRVEVDVRPLQAEEVSVKLGKDNAITVEGKRDGMVDEYGTFSYHLVRRFNIPPEFDGNRAQSRWYPEGYLAISVPNIKAKNAGRAIPIKKDFVKAKL